MPLPFPFDFKKPDYKMVFEWRFERIKSMREDPSILPVLRKFYKDNPAQFIIDWGVTIDPRNVSKKLPTLMPFILFPRQEEFIYWYVERINTQTSGVAAKSRTVGLSWITIATCATLCLFTHGFVAGFGSRKEEYVDKLGAPKSLFYKARKFVEHLPVEFRGTWDIRKHAPHMRIEFPDTQSVMVGEAGDGMGRGDRTSVFNVDEASHVERPHLVEASLSETTDSRIDISTPCGMDNPFARKYHSGRIATFRFHWKEDPRRDQVWYDKKCAEIDDPTVIAQELDLDFTASKVGVIIPATWVNAAIDAHLKLGIKPTGERHLGFDVADEGRDKNALCGRHGFMVTDIEEWSGRGDDIRGSVDRVFLFAQMNRYGKVSYDADGLGAGVRGDARVVNEEREHKIEFIAFHGSGAVVNPEDEVFPSTEYVEGTDPEIGRTNEDYLQNRKAQGWLELYKRFKATYGAVVHGRAFDPDEIISLDSRVPGIQQLVTELPQPVWVSSKNGKLMVDKTPDGTKSPNVADACMITFAPREQESISVWDDNVKLVTPTNYLHAR